MTNQVHPLNKSPSQNLRLFMNTTEWAQLFTGSGDSYVCFPNSIKERKICFGPLVSSQLGLIMRVFGISDVGC